MKKRVKLKEEIPLTKREDTDEWIEVKNKTKQNIVNEKKTEPIIMSYKKKKKEKIEVLIQLK